MDGIHVVLALVQGVVLVLEVPQVQKAVRHFVGIVVCCGRTVVVPVHLYILLEAVLDFKPFLVGVKQQFQGIYLPGHLNILPDEFTPPHFPRILLGRSDAAKEGGTQGGDYYFPYFHPKI